MISDAARESDRELSQLIKRIKLEHPFWVTAACEPWPGKDSESLSIASVSIV